MSVNLKQNADGSLGLQGTNLDDGGFIEIDFNWIPTSVNTPFFIANRPFRVKAIRTRVEVAGTDASAVTAVIRKAPSGTALTSGTALHSGSINLKGTAATNQTITLSTTSSDLDIAVGDCIAINFTGTLTAAVGAVLVELAPK